MLHNYTYNCNNSSSYLTILESTSLISMFASPVKYGLEFSNVLLPCMISNNLLKLLWLL